MGAKHSNSPVSVYAIHCTANGRNYIGCSSNVVTRVASHFAELKNGYKRQSARDGFTKTREDSQWQVDYNEYGKDGFEVFLIEENIPNEIRREREAFWIDYFNSSDPEYGYNIRSETRQGLGFVIQKGLPPMPANMPDEIPSEAEEGDSPFFKKYLSLCKEKGISPTRAAEEMGISRNLPTKWKRTGGTPSVGTVRVIAEYFGVPITEVIQ